MRGKVYNTKLELSLSNSQEIFLASIETYVRTLNVCKRSGGFFWREGGFLAEALWPALQRFNECFIGTTLARRFEVFLKVPWGFIRSRGFARKSPDALSIYWNTHLFIFITRRVRLRRPEWRRGVRRM
jgi:hypothetical protein